MADTGSETASGCEQRSWRPGVLRDAEALLERHGWKDTRVYRVESPGDAQEETVTILFVSSTGSPKIGFLEISPKGDEQGLTVRSGWSV